MASHKQSIEQTAATPAATDVQAAQQQAAAEQQAAPASTPSAGTATGDTVRVRYDSGLRGIRHTREFEADGFTFRVEHDGTTNHPVVEVPRAWWEAHRNEVNDPALRERLPNSRYSIVSNEE